MIFLYIIIVLLFIAGIICILWQVSNFVSVFFGAPYVRSGRKIVTRALELAKLKKGEVLYDLGSGQGDCLIAGAKMGAKVTGFEISPFYWLCCKIRTFRYRNVDIQYRNISNIDYSKADVCYCYLLPEFLAKLAPKIKKELKKSARFISVSFKVPGLKLLSQEKFGIKTIYVYSK